MSNESERETIDVSCPGCGGRTTRPRYGAHPAASKLRSWAYWSVAIGFSLAPILIFIIAFSPGRGIGFNLMGIALAPAAALVTASYFYSEVWHVSCGRCRKSYFRSDGEADWRRVDQE